MIDISLGNLHNLFAGNIRDRDARELREAWTRTEALWAASPFAGETCSNIALGVVQGLIRTEPRPPAATILGAVCDIVDELLRQEDVTALMAEWEVIDNDPVVASHIRKLLARRGRWCGNYDQMIGVFTHSLQHGLIPLFQTLPEPCFGSWEAGADVFGVPLIEMIDDPAEFVRAIMQLAYDPDCRRFEIFDRLRAQFAINILVASGFRADDDISARREKLIFPTAQRGKTPMELAQLYLRNTPLLALAQEMIPFHVSDEARFEHCHIVGGTGHGKTQLMQRMIHTDIAAARYEKRSVVVIDSQGDLINKLVRLSLFDPKAPYSLGHRLILIDPADVEFPFSLNLFDSHLERTHCYSAADRERVLNGVIELYEIFFSSMLGAELTQKQGVIFRYLARLMMTIPGATIHTLMQLMEDGKAFKSYMDKLEGSARHFFATEFFHPSFAATKKQILKRLWGVLSTPAFERMFAQKDNKLDLFEALNDGSIILISTAKDLLKNEGSALLGRFLIAMLSQAALERSTVPSQHRTPTFVYIDEAQEYFDDSIETILTQARKYRVGLTLAHQTLDQLTPRLRASILANTSFKCVGGVSNRDAHALAGELRTDADFIESMRRYKDRSEFAVWLKHETPHAIRLSVPLGFLERQPLMDEEGLARVLADNRSLYCCPADQLPSMDFAAEGPEKEEETSPAVRKEPGRPAQPSDQATLEGPLAAAVPEPKPAHPPVSEPSAPYMPPPRRAAPVAVHDHGKGGSQHKYVQHLIKALAEERGFRAVIEAPVDGGEADVALYRDGLSVACEISVTSTAKYETKNLAKCVGSGFDHVLAVGSDAKRLRAIGVTAQAALSSEDFARVTFLTPDAIAAVLDTLAAPHTEETTVRGYKVKVSKTVVSESEAQDRRSSVARIIAQSLRNMPTK